MKRSDEKFLAHWEAVRRTGRLKYGLLYGTVWGVLTYLIHGLFQLGGNTFREAFLSPEALMYLLALAGGGILLYATVMWGINNRFYQKRKTQANA